MIKNKDKLYLSKGFSNIRVLPNLVALLAFFPYIRLGSFGLPTEVQLWSSLLAWLTVGLMAIKGQLQLNRTYQLLILFGVLFLVYVPLGTTIDLDQYLRKSASVLLMIGVAIVSQYIRPDNLLKVINFAVVIWFLFAILGVIKPTLYIDITRLFVPGALGAYGDRGVTSLAPEATDFGFLMAYFWVIVRVCAIVLKRRGLKQPSVWLYGMILANIIMSQSAAGVFTLFIIIGIELFFYNSSKAGSIHLLLKVFSILVAISGLMLFSWYEPETGIRGFDLMVLALNNPTELLNTTFSYRLAHNLVGMFGLIDSYFMGNGAGTFTIKGHDVYRDYEISKILNLEGWYRYNVPLTVSISPLAIFPVIIFEYGIWGILFIITIFRSVFCSRVPFRLLIVSIMFLTWFQSFPIAFPLFWLVLGLSSNRYFCENKMRPKQYFDRYAGHKSVFYKELI